MIHRTNPARAWMFVGTLTAFLLSWPTNLLAQCCGGSASYRGPSSGSSSCCSGSESREAPPASAYEPLPPPYRGQIYCPVTGEKLGFRRPAEEALVGGQKPSFVGRLVGKKGTPAKVIYVCCPECVAKAERDASTCLQEVAADKAAFTFTYASAPPQRPSRTPAIQPAVATGQLTHGAEAVSARPAPFGGQRTCPVTGKVLGSMGQPVPLTLQGQTIYVCCQGCVIAVMGNPDAYLARVDAARARP